MTTTQTITTPPTGPTAPAAPASEAQRPAWLPEKFKSPEDMAKAYGELEKKLGTSTTTPPAATPAQSQTEATKPSESQPQQQPQQTPEQKADFSKYAEEFSKDGKLSDATYAEIAAKHGLSKADVDQYIAGQQAQAKIVTAEIYTAAGGEQQFKTLMDWASKNLPQAEKDAYNKAAQSGDYATVKLAVAGMAARFNAAYGQQPNLVGGKPPANSGVVPFTSWSQITDAMADRRYANDPSYRKEIEARIAASNV